MLLFLPLPFPSHPCLAKSLLPLPQKCPHLWAMVWPHHVGPLPTLPWEQLCVFGDHAEICSAPTRSVFGPLSSDHSIPQVCVGFGQSPFNNTLVLWLICNCFRGGVLIASWGCLLICERPSCEFSKIFSFSLPIKNTYIRTPYSQ